MPRYEGIAMSTVRISRGVHEAHIFPHHSPPARASFRIDFWWNNFMQHETVDGFTTFDAALAYAEEILP